MALASLALLSSSCKWVGESKIEPQKVEIQSQVQDCFVDFKSTFDKFLKSDIEDSELISFFDCAEKSIDDFMRKTAERDPAVGYSREEVQSLLKTFLLKNKSETDSDRYSRMFLIVKRAIIGGSSDYLSREDWRKVKNLIPNLKQFFMSVKPYTQYYYFFNKSLYQNKRHSFKLLDTSHDQFADRLSVFLDLLKSNGSQLSKIELQYLKDELILNETLRNIDPLLTEVIHIFFSFQSSQHQENWNDLLQIAEKGLRVMTYVKKLMLQTDSIFVPQGGVAVAALVHSIIDAFAYTHTVNSNLNLDQDLVERFVVSLNQSALFLKNIEDAEAVRAFVNNMGKSLFVLDSSQRWHISTLKINQFKFIHNRWVESLVQSLEDTSMWDLKDQYENLLFQNVDYDSSPLREAEEIYEDIVKPSALNLVFPGTEYKVNFQISRNLSQQNDVISNFYKTMLSNVVLFVFDTYGKQSRVADNANKHVSELTSARFYNDIRDVAISEGLGSPLSCDSGSRTFLEANLFTYSANGNDKIEVQEGLEWLSLVVSSSSVANKLFNDVAANEECVLPTTSLFSKKPYLKEQCVRRLITENFRTYFNHMPNLILFIESQNKIDDFYQNLFEVTRYCSDSNLPVSYDEIVYAVSLLGYIEALFERYDVEQTSFRFFTRPRNDLLEIDELNLAFNERFRTVLQRMAKIQNGVDLTEWQTEHLFKKLLIYKRMPISPEGRWEQIKWAVSDLGVNVRPLDRIDIYKMFNSILTMNQMPEVGVTYCRSLTLAWEEYLQQQVFNVEVPTRSCESATPPRTNQRVQN